jgi:hypothetical protein
MVVIRICTGCFAESEIGADISHTQGCAEQPRIARTRRMYRCSDCARTSFRYAESIKHSAQCQESRLDRT